IGLSMLITFAVVFYFGILGAIFAVCFSFTLFICALAVKACKNKKSVLILVAVVVLLSTAYFNLYNSYIENKTKKYDGETVELVATLTNSHSNKDYFYYELNSDKIDSKSSGFKILLRSNLDLGVEYGDKITCSVTLFKMRNNYYMSKKFDYTAYPDTYPLKYTVKKENKKGIGYLPIYIKDRLTYAISVLIPGYSGELCNAIALGDKFGLSPELYNEFQSTGLSYIIVVSGMHMSIIAFYIILMFRWTGKRRIGRIIRNSFVILFIVLYIFITGCSASATRSGIMIIVVFLGRYFKRKSDAQNNLGLAALLLTAFNPFAVGDVGMLMSFSSVAGILIISPKLMDLFDKIFFKRIKNLTALKILSVHKRERIRDEIKLTAIKILRNIYELFAISVCAVVAISPLTLMFYGVCNPFVIIYSIFVSPFISGLMIFSLVTAVIWYVPILNFLSPATALIAKLIASWVILVVDFVSDIPYLSFYAEPLYMQICFAVTLVIFAVAFLLKNRRKSVVVAVFVSVIVFAFGFTANLALSSNKTELKVLGAGDGTTVIFKSPEVTDILACGGTYSLYSNISEKIHTMDEKINLLVLPSANQKREVKFASDILSEFDVSKVLLYYRYNTNERNYRLARNCKVYREFKEGESVAVNLSKDVVDYIVNVDNHTWQYITDEETSVLIAPYGGKVSEIPKKYINPDYLVLNGKIDDIDEINYGEIIWTSDKEVPSKYRNVSFAYNNDYSVEFY
ncbi:MAG: ComEC/Rec2 family competence protein, partial [Ruminococcus sp.]|nr:ComEC/Rec2 family competence protein [Ruminococcus sp.]